ncbi:serine/threonine-protein kinase hal4 [Podospora appendiculata]|uniref:non-specific serine/threonine protein kinase n=1 Tax=Podospora appendiculata TaxID=314037 RepID=A0AAE0XFG1_9PEZI|nr:serine/threonine-protein kinase hal4 [Podospora appendiculata]
MPQQSNMAASVSDAKADSTQRPSQPSSIRSVEQGPGRSPSLVGQNGTLPTSSLEQLSSKQPAEKGSVKNRLTRMFSTNKDISSRASPDITQPPKKMAADGKTTSPNRSAPSSPPTKPVTPQRKQSSTDVPTDKLPAPVTATKPKTTNGRDPPAQRFETGPDFQGGHEHHLKSSRRQEKLMDMIKGLLGKKPEARAENDLSLVSNWVDTLKQEKDGLGVDKKGIPNASATLVEKYGKCHEIVGRGAFGIVRISHKKMENGVGEKLFAVKEFRRRPEEGEKKYSKRLTAEFCISSSLRHPNVIHTLDLLKDSKGDYCEVMEFCAGGDLYTLVLAAGKLEVQEADCFFKQMMRGVEYMHEMGVAHRDLKPENLLLTTHGGLKITDFGNGECFRMAWENDAHMVSGLCGSAPYIAPEEYVDKEFDARAVDVWACGVIYMAMRTGRHLWRVARKDEDEFYARYLEGRRDEEGYGPIESLHRARCRNVIYSILDPNPSRRITASQVLKSEWGREIKLCKAGEEGL